MQCHSRTHRALPASATSANSSFDGHLIAGIKENSIMTKSPRILYCHCAYANVVPQEVKNEVLTKLAESGVAFDAVPDLCEMSARRDPALKELAEEGTVKIAA